jgi:hypothetical protein
LPQERTRGSSNDLTSQRPRRKYVGVRFLSALCRRLKYEVRRELERSEVGILLGVIVWSRIQQPTEASLLSVVLIRWVRHGGTGI